MRERPSPDCPDPGSLPRQEIRRVRPQPICDPPAPELEPEFGDPFDDLAPEDPPGLPQELQVPSDTYAIDCSGYPAYLQNPAWGVPDGNSVTLEQGAVTLRFDWTRLDLTNDELRSLILAQTKNSLAAKAAANDLLFFVNLGLRTSRAQAIIDRWNDLKEQADVTARTRALLLLECGWCSPQISLECPCKATDPVNPLPGVTLECERRSPLSPEDAYDQAFVLALSRLQCAFENRPLTVSCLAPQPYSALPWELAVTGTAAAWAPLDLLGRNLMFRTAPSPECGGTETRRQIATATVILTVPPGKTLNASWRLTGYVENNVEREIAKAVVGTTETVITSVSNGQPCQVVGITETGTAVLEAGFHQVTVSFDTGDGSDHGPENGLCFTFTELSLADVEPLEGMINRSVEIEAGAVTAATQEEADHLAWIQAIGGLLCVFGNRETTVSCVEEFENADRPIQDLVNMVVTIPENRFEEFSFEDANDVAMADALAQLVCVYEVDCTVTCCCYPQPEGQETVFDDDAPKDLLCIENVTATSATGPNARECREIGPEESCLFLRGGNAGSVCERPVSNVPPSATASGDSFESRDDALTVACAAAASQLFCEHTNEPVTIECPEGTVNAAGTRENVFVPSGVVVATNMSEANTLAMIYGMALLQCVPQIFIASARATCCPFPDRRPQKKRCEKPDDAGTGFPAYSEKETRVHMEAVEGEDVPAVIEEYLALTQCPNWTVSSKADPYAYWQVAEEGDIRVTTVPPTAEGRGESLDSMEEAIEMAKADALGRVECDHTNREIINDCFTGNRLLSEEEMGVVPAGLVLANSTEEANYIAEAMASGLRKPVCGRGRYTVSYDEPTRRLCVCEGSLATPPLMEEYGELELFLPDLEGASLEGFKCFDMSQEDVVPGEKYEVVLLVEAGEGRVVFRPLKNKN